MQRKLLVIVGILGAITIIIGAFGAHTLKSHLTEAQMQTFQTGVSYQMMHVLALLIISSLMQKSPTKWLKFASYFMISGIVLFS